MPISLIVGPPNSGRAPELRRRLEAALDRDPVLVVPTGDDAARFERDLCREGGAMLGVSIRTFASLFDEVGRATGAALPPRLSGAQRLALVRAAVASTPLRLLARSARRTGFAPALDALIGELQAALVEPGAIEIAARDLDDGDYELELAALYASYLDLLAKADRSDTGSRAKAALEGIRRDPAAWGERPLFVYGFDDFSRAQLELLSALGDAAGVAVAINYGDREALKVLAGLRSELEHELGAELVAELDHDPGHTGSESLRHLDRWLFEPGAPLAEPDGSVAMLESAGELGEAEAIGAEIASALAAGIEPDEIVVVARDAAGRGPALGRVLGRFGIPTAVEAHVPLDRTAVGRSLIGLCRAASGDGAPSDLLAHLRADPSVAPTVPDWLERRIRRERPSSVDAAVATWATPPRHLASVRAADGASDRMRALGAIARELAEAPHDKQAPVSAADGGLAPFEPLELRAAAVAGELLDELAEVGRLPGCSPPDLADAIEAIEGARVPLWRGPSDGRVRILDPYRVRAARASHLFCAGLQEGEFPRRSPQDPLLSDERRSRLGIPALIRRDAQDEERYLFHACVSRPTERLYLSWQSSDDDGAPSARSPFVDEVLDLLAPDPETAAERLTRSRGLDRVVFDPGDAPTERELARALAVDGRDADHAAALDGLGVGSDTSRRVLADLARIPDPAHRPGPLNHEPVLAELRARKVVSASSLEGWVQCSYRWFVDHELEPQRLDPAPDPLRLGSVAHEALHRLYADPPGGDTIPRPGDLERWRGRLRELIEETAGEAGMDPGEPPDSVVLARLRAQIERFLADEAETETDLRPRTDLLEARFGFDDDGSPALRLGEVQLRGAIDRIDLSPDGRSALVRDYKTSAKMPGRQSWEKEGKLQLQLYVLAAAESLGLEPIGGLYHPLAGRGDRRPRGVVVAGDPHLEGMHLVRGDDCDADDLDAELERARALAVEKAAAMRGGEIARDPIGGRCPRYCTYQAVCRLERAVGIDDDSGADNGS